MHTRTLRVGLALMVFAGMISIWSHPAAAQTSGAAYKYEVSPYFWFSGLKGTVGARDRTAEVDASFRDIFDNLNLGAMGTFEVRWDRWRLLVDTLYINVSAERATAGALFTDAEVTVKMFILDPEIGYAVFRGERAEFDVFGGVRYWHLKNELNLISGGVERIHAVHTRSWADPIVGGKYRWEFWNSMYVTVKADVGGFNAAANIDWQAFGGIGLKFNDRISGVMGYRHLAVDYGKDGFIFDTGMKGLILGLGISF
jgi:hypothetical protein